MASETETIDDSQVRELSTEPGVVLQCGWGRLLFAHTFPDPEIVGKAVLEERPGQRDIAFYLNDPQIVLNTAPQDLFLDPSTTFRLDLGQWKTEARPHAGFVIERLSHKEDIDAINRIYRALGMVPIDADYVWAHRRSERFFYVLARQEETGDVLGAAMGVDHMACFDDLQNGSSLWALGVDPQAQCPGVGQALTAALADEFKTRGRAVMDLSVMHSNKIAVKLYRKLGFNKVSVFAIKRRNSINEKLFVGAPPEAGFNPYATIIINEALRRGIAVEPLEVPLGYFRLSLGGRAVTCRESLSELTSAIAFSRCDDKKLTLGILRQAKLNVPSQIEAGTAEEAGRFLEKHQRVVVKPARGEQGRGISVDLRTKRDLDAAIEGARQVCDTVLIEQYVSGDDLRIIVINHEVVAAAIRRPAEILGTGEHTVRELIERLSRRRAAATGGESRIPVDAETERCIANGGATWDSVLPEGQTLQVRKAANLHTGGTIHDVTEKLHPELAAAAVRAAQVLEIPVVGLDFLVPAVDRPDYVIIEANERPGLANHEPQPTAEKFVDFLFPQTISPTRAALFR